MSPQSNPHWPLTEEDLIKINQVLSQIEMYMPHLERAHRAGVDQTVNMQRMNDTRDKLMQLKQHYFPGR